MDSLPRTGRFWGLCLVLLSALLFGLAGTLTKAIDAGVWTIAGWRGLVGGILIMLYVTLSRGETFQLGWRGWALATLGAIASLTFILAFKLTYVANVAVIYATVPFMAAGMAWLLMRERLHLGTALASLLSAFGVALIVADGLRSGAVLGDLVALLMTVLIAIYIALIRLFRQGNVVFAGAVSAFQLFALAWVFADPLAVSHRDAGLLAGFGAAFAGAVVTWTEGTKRLSAADSALIGTAETPFAIFLAWLLLSEQAPWTSLIGGAVVLLAVLANVVFDIRRGLSPERQ